MITNNELERWSARWQSSAALNVSELVQSATARRRQQQVAVVAEILTSVIVVWQVSRLLGATLDPFHRAWIWGLIAFLDILQAVFLVMRRRLWRSPTTSVADLLQHSFHDARFGIKHALLSGSAFVVAGISSLPIAYTSWRDALGDEVRLNTFFLTALIYFAVFLAGVAISAWHWNTQRQRLRNLESVGGLLK